MLPRQVNVAMFLHAQERTEDKEGSKEKRKKDSPPPAASAKEVETKVGTLFSVVYPAFTISKVLTRLSLSFSRFLTDCFSLDCSYCFNCFLPCLPTFCLYSSESHPPSEKDSKNT